MIFDKNQGMIFDKNQVTGYGTESQSFAVCTMFARSVRSFRLAIDDPREGCRTSAVVAPYIVNWGATSRRILRSSKMLVGPMSAVMKAWPRSLAPQPWHIGLSRPICR